MPTQTVNPADNSGEVVAQWKSFGSGRRAALLQKMTPKQKKTLRLKIEAASDPFAEFQKPVATPAVDPFAEFQVPLEATATPQPPQGLYDRAKAGFLTATAPNNPGPDTRTAADFGLPANASAEDLQKMRGANPLQNPIAEFTKGAVRGAATLVRHPLETLRATAQSIYDLANAPLPLPGVIGHPTDSQRASMQRVNDQVHGVVQGFKENPEYAAGEMAGPAIVTEGAGELVKLPVKGVAELRRMAAERFGPKAVSIAGEKVPVLVGEASPETAAGRTQVKLKRAGVGAAKFDKVSRLQQEAVKKVIRNVAQRTSDLTGPMGAEPGVAMADAADATFAQARPMYQALDSSLVEVPDSLSNVSRVTASAIERARKLGVEVNTDPAGGSVAINGRTFTPGTDPVAWENLKAQGLTPATTGGQPLSTYIKVRSELLKLQRGASDAVLRSKIGDEVRTMNGQMDEALKGSPLHENWTEANRLWSKGYALRDVADAITKTTKGTPAAEQAAGISPVQTRVQAPALVKRLNELERNGTLSRAFTPDEAGNLRQSIDLLDRASASAGKGGGFAHTYSPRSVIWRTVMGLPSIPLVAAMTTTDGLAALRAAETASSQQAAITAMAHLASIAAAATTPKTAGEAKQLVNQLQRR